MLAHDMRMLLPLVSYSKATFIPLALLMAYVCLEVLLDVAWIFLNSFPEIPDPPSFCSQ